MKFIVTHDFFAFSNAWCLRSCLRGDYFASKMHFFCMFVTPVYMPDIYLIHIPDLCLMHISNAYSRSLSDTRSRSLCDAYISTRSLSDAHTMCLILDNIAYIPDLSVTHISDLSLFETQISCLKNKFI